MVYPLYFQKRLEQRLIRMSDMENTFALKRALRKQIAATLKQLDQAEINRQCKALQLEGRLYMS
jgi:signal recognition particle subunit SEC65